MSPPHELKYGTLTMINNLFLFIFLNWWKVALQLFVGFCRKTM